MKPGPGPRAAPGDGRAAMCPSPGWGLNAGSSAQPHQEPHSIARDCRELEPPDELEALPVYVQVRLPSFAPALVKAFLRAREHPVLDTPIGCAVEGFSARAVTPHRVSRDMGRIPGIDHRRPVPSGCRSSREFFRGSPGSAGSIDGSVLAAENGTARSSHGCTGRMPVAVTWRGRTRRRSIRQMGRRTASADRPSVGAYESAVISSCESRYFSSSL